MKRTGFLYSGLLLVIGLLIVVQMGVENYLSTGGIQLNNIENQIHVFQKDNAILEEKVLTASSLTNLSQKAENEGFTQNTSSDIVISHQQLPIAYNQ